MPIKVLLTDDRHVMRSAIRRILEEERRIEVVGKAETFAKALPAGAGLLAAGIILFVSAMKTILKY